MSTMREPPAVHLADEAATLQFGARLARALPATSGPLVLYLHGELGAGKTTLARGMLRALGETGAIRSPTYALVAEYQPDGARVLHLDLYRLGSPEELAALGLADFLPDSRLWLIEWPERGAGGELPAPDAHVHLAPQDAGRIVRIEPVTEQGRRWVAALAADSG